MREWMKEKRHEKGLTQQFVAEKLGITTQYYQQIESNSRQTNLAVSLIMDLSSIFGMSPLEIVKLENQKT